MIDQIKFGSKQTDSGKVVNTVCIWVAGTMFSADASGPLDQKFARFAELENIPTLEQRPLIA